MKHLFPGSDKADRDKEGLKMKGRGETIGEDV